MSGDLIEASSLKGITADCDLVTAARFMTERSVAALGVYSHDGHELLGLMTERDITRSIASGRDPRTIRVQEVMSPDPVKAQEPITHDEARDLMKNHHVRHLILLRDGSEHIVSIRDV